MKPFSRLALLLQLLLLGCATAWAQGTAPAVPDLGAKVKTGDIVDVADTDGRHVAGRVVDLQAETVTLTGAGQRFTIPSNRVVRITKKDSVKNGALIGLAIGAVPGAIGAWAISTICDNEGADCGVGSAVLFALGAGAGLAIGAGADGLHHAVVYDTGAAVAHEYTPQVFGAAGFTRLGTRGAGGLNVPIDLSGGWGITGINGMGLELQASRSMVGSSRPVGCITLSPFLAGSSAGTCIGSGIEGVEQLTTVSGKFVYTVGHSRVRTLSLTNRLTLRPQLNSDARDPGRVERHERQRGDRLSLVIAVMNYFIRHK